MDMHITTSPDIDPRVGVPLGSPVRLPGGRGTLPHIEGLDPDPNSHTLGTMGASDTGVREASQPQVPPVRPRSRRTALFSTVAVVVVLAGIGGAAWAERQGMLNLPLPPQVVAFLRTPLPAFPDTVAEVGVQPARKQVAAPAAARPNPQQTSQAGHQQAEFAAFKSGDAVTEVGVAANGPPASSPALAIPPLLAHVDPSLSTPASTPESTSRVTAPETGAAVSKPVDTVAAKPAPAVPAVTTLTIITPVVTTPVAATVPVVAAPSQSVPAPKPAGSGQPAIDSAAEQMSSKVQADVIGRVRELGTQLAETRLTVSQLKATVAELKQQLDTRVTEFDVRLGLAETGTVLAQSARAALPPPVIAAPVVPVRATGALRQPATATSVASTNVASRSVKDFRVQGASPGLAVLNALAPAPGEAPVLYLALGDQVPGLGRIKSIYQRGTTWVVQTDSGLIQ